MEQSSKKLEDLSNKLDLNASDEEYVLFCFIQSLRNIIHWKKGTESDVFELNEKRLQSLSLKNINMEDVKSTFLILKGIRAIKETNNNEFSEVIEILNSPDLGLIEQQISNIKATEIFEKQYDEEQQIYFLLSLVSSGLVKRLIYSLYNNAVYSVFKSVNVDEQKRLLEKIHLLIKRIEPRIDNSEHSIPAFYKMLKREYNEWTFSWFVSQGYIEEGFAWLESIDEGKGLDFLCLKESVHNLKGGLLGSLETGDICEDEFFVVPSYYYPHAYKYEDVLYQSEVFDAQSLKERIEIKQYVARYFSSFDFYDNILRDKTKMDKSTREKIFSKIYTNTEDLLQWKQNRKYSIYILNVFLPFTLGEMLVERGNYDEAIFVFHNSTGKREDREKAIEKCKYSRDGFIYDELKKMLRDISQAEQKQLLGYGKVFKIEIQLRNIIDNKMTAVRSTNKWLENESNPKLKAAVKECKERYDRYQNDCYNKEEKSVRLIDFTTLPELTEIIRENWKHFQEEFKDYDQFFSLLVPIKNIRLDIAHARFLDNKQLATLSDRFDELDRVLELKKPWENQNTPLINSSREKSDN